MRQDEEASRRSSDRMESTGPRRGFGSRHAKSCRSDERCNEARRGIWRSSGGLESRTRPSYYPFG